MTATMEAIEGEATSLVAPYVVTASARVASPLDEARRMATRMLECARPNHESMLGYALACSEWRRHGFHKCTGPLFDEVNALREVWWSDGLASPRGSLSLESLAVVVQATAPA